MRVKAESLLPGRWKGRWGYINLQGDWVCEPQFDFAGRYGDGFGHATTGNQLHILDDSCSVVAIVENVCSYTTFSEGKLEVEDLTSGRCFYVNTDGERRLDKDFDLALSFANERAFVRNGDKWGLLNSCGKWVVEPSFSQARPFCVGSDVTAVGTDGGQQWHLLDKQGRVVLPKYFEFLGSTSEGLVPFGKTVYGQLRFGVIDCCGREIVPPTFAACDNCYHDGYLGVECDDG